MFEFNEEENIDIFNYLPKMLSFTFNRSAILCYFEKVRVDTFGIEARAGVWKYEKSLDLTPRCTDNDCNTQFSNNNCTLTPVFSCFDLSMLNMTLEQVTMYT